MNNFVHDAWIGHIPSSRWNMFSKSLVFEDISSINFSRDLIVSFYLEEIFSRIFKE